MSIGLVLQFKGMSSAKYDAVMKELGLSSSPANWPDGIVSHAAGTTDDGLCVVDIWRTQADFDKFFTSRLQPAMDRAGGLPKPQITTFQVVNTYKHG